MSAWASLSSKEKCADEMYAMLEYVAGEILSDDFGWSELTGKIDTLLARARGEGL